MKKVLNIAIFCLASLGLCMAQTQAVSREAGFFTASAYAFGSTAPGVKVIIGSTGTGSQTYTMAKSSVSLADGRTVFPFSTTAPILFMDGSPETVTPSAVSGCTSDATVCTITATVSNAHGQGAIVGSGTFGMQEAVNDANNFGGGTVVADQSWFLLGGTKAIIVAMVSTTPKVWVLDNSNGAPMWVGKSGTAAAAYSYVNNDQVFTVTLSGGAATKTLSQTYGTAPICVATDKTAANAVSAQPTTTTVVFAGTTTDVIQVYCQLQK